MVTKLFTFFFLLSLDPQFLVCVKSHFCKNGDKLLSSIIIFFLFTYILFFFYCLFIEFKERKRWNLHQLREFVCMIWLRHVWFRWSMCCLLSLPSVNWQSFPTHRQVILLLLFFFVCASWTFLFLPWTILPVQWFEQFTDQFNDDDDNSGARWDQIINWWLKV